MCLGSGRPYPGDYDLIGLSVVWVTVTLNLPSIDSEAKAESPCPVCCYFVTYVITS